MEILVGAKSLRYGEALALFYALKKAKAIEGNEYFSFQKERAQSPVHLSLISKKAKVDYIKSLKPDFFSRTRVFFARHNSAENPYRFYILS